MNIKILAAFQTAAVVVSVTGISVMISLVAEYYPKALVWTGSTLLAGSLIYLIYSVVLGRLETQEKYEEIIKKY